jgi:hypothetical protein
MMTVRIMHLPTTMTMQMNQVTIVAMMIMSPMPEVVMRKCRRCTKWDVSWMADRRPRIVAVAMDNVVVVDIVDARST